jgi:uncharacterized protein YkwD
MTSSRLSPNLERGFRPPRCGFLLASLALLVSFSPAASGQAPDANFRNPAVWRELEDEIFRHVNAIRAQPAAFAEQFLVPLKATRQRIPEPAAEPFQAFKLLLNPGHRHDYLWISELREDRPDEELSLALIDETIDVLRKTPPLPAWTRNDVLDRAARFFSRDFLTGGKERPDHIDRFGRRAGQRIAACGATRRGLDEWKRICDQMDEQQRIVLQIYRDEETYFRVEYPTPNRCRYYSIPEHLGQFVTKHGREVTLPVLDRPGFECFVRVEPSTRRIASSEASIEYPLPLPVLGENVVWGKWSRQWAARGLVCWWLIDPGIPDRGHRQLLLDPDYRFAGVGCAWSPEIGWVATIDCATDPLEPYEPVPPRNEESPAARPLPAR